MHRKKVEIDNIGGQTRLGYKDHETKTTTSALHIIYGKCLPSSQQAGAKCFHFKKLKHFPRGQLQMARSFMVSILALVLVIVLVVVRTVHTSGQKLTESKNFLIVKSPSDFASRLATIEVRKPA